MRERYTEKRHERGPGQALTEHLMLTQHCTRGALCTAFKFFNSPKTCKILVNIIIPKKEKTEA
jgi:hypothetical protein